MARHPDWFGRLDAIEETARQSSAEWLGRNEVQSLFGVSERDAIRLLHKLGAEDQANALFVGRAALLAQLGAVRAGSTYAAFSRKREGVANQLAAARAQTPARQFRVRSAVADERRAQLEALPETVTWKRAGAVGPARFEILYDDGADLMWQLAEFLEAAGSDRAGFFRGTEPGEDPPS